MKEGRIVIRPETPQDQSAVFRVNEVAFGRPEEARLVDALRPAVRPFLSLVAVEGEQVVGHILFTPITIEFEGGASTGLGLAPMAVLPAYQRQGIGSRLVRAGLEECARQGIGVVVVLGHPTFYPRFGFMAAASRGLRCEYPVPEEAFMVVELIPGALRKRTGLVKYRPEFAEV
jgi:putative acetyltransferase